MFSEHTLAFEHTQDTVFNAFASLPPDFKWGDGMLYPDTTTQPSSRAGDQRLVLRDAKTVIEEYTETLIEIDAPVAISLTLTLDDFAMSRNAPTGHLLPSAASMARARKHISEGRATNLIMSLTLSNFGAATIWSFKGPDAFGQYLSLQLHFNPQSGEFWFLTHSPLRREQLRARYQGTFR